MKLSSIHVKSLAINASNISTTTINGQEHYVIRGAVPIVDDIVMNGGLYPAEEINNSYLTMERKLMPLGHPMVNGKYVSANDPQAVNDYYAGAWAQNVNKAVADAKPDGKRLIQRLDDMIAGNNVDPIHVSNGLLLNKEQKAGESKGKKHSWVAHNMQFDHIAILLDEPGAGTPDEGVGMFVNADGQEADVESTSLIDAANSMKDGWWQPSLRARLSMVLYPTTRARSPRIQDQGAAVRHVRSAATPLCRVPRCNVRLVQGRTRCRDRLHRPGKPDILHGFGLVQNVHT